MVHAKNYKTESPFVTAQC